MSAYDPVTIDDYLPATQAEVGPMVSGADVEAAVKKTLHDWLWSYLAEYEGQHQIVPGTIARPRGWSVTGRDLQKLTPDQLPCVVLMSGGVIQQPVKTAAPGRYTARWSVDLGVVFSAAYGDSSRRDMQAYVCAMCVLLMQRPLEGLPGARVDWRGGEVYDEMDFDSSRTYSAGVVGFDIEVENVRWSDGGPPPYAAPPTDPNAPLDPWTTVTSADVTVENQPPD